MHFTSNRRKGGRLKGSTNTLASTNDPDDILTHRPFHNSVLKHYENNHTRMPFVSIDVIDTTQRFDLATVESHYIKIHKPPLNQQQSSTPLLLFPCRPRQ